MKAIAALMAMGLAAAMLTACSPAPDRAASKSQTRPQQVQRQAAQAPILFDCSDANGGVTLRAAQGGGLSLELRQPGKPTQSYGPNWAEIRFGWVGGQGGGHQSHVRLRSATGEFILSEGENGQYADRPGRTYAGALQFVDNGSGKSTLDIACPATPVNVAVQGKVAAHLLSNGQPRPADEDANGPYDGWF